VDKSRFSAKVQVELTAFELLSVCSNVLLAMRHPGNKASADVLGRFLNDAFARLKSVGYLTDADIEMIRSLNRETVRAQRSKNGEIDLFRSTERPS